MPTDSAEYLRALNAIQEEYRRSLPDKIRELNEACEQLDGDVRDPCALPLLIRLAHRLAGSGGSYGFDTVSEAAHVLELYAKSRDATVPLSEGERAQIKLYLAQLSNIVDAVQEASANVMQE